MTPEALPSATSGSRTERAVAALALAVGLLGAALYWWARQSMWEDELIALTHGLQPLPSFFVQVLRNDIHPPVYFLALKAWAAVAFGSDRWLLASSLLAAIGSAALLAHVAHRLAGARAAWWAAALFCVLPNFAWAGGNLRMYGLLPGLVIGMWYLWRCWLLRGGSGLAAAMVVQLLLAYCHAIEFYFIFFVLFGLGLELRGRLPPGRLRAALWAQFGLGICLLPLVASALLRGTEPLAGSSLAGLMLAPAQLFTGWALADDPLALSLAGSVFVALLVLAWHDRVGRALALGIGCAAVVTAIAIGFLGKPMFKPPVFTANLVPFFVLGAALGAARLSVPAGRVSAALLLGGLAVLSIPWSQRMLPAENYGPAGVYLAARLQPGDVVVVPRNSVYWGVMRYAATPAWGRPLAIMPPSNEAWQKLKGVLGAAWSQRLGLNPERDHVDHAAVRYVHASSVTVPAAPASRIWVVQRARYLHTISFDRPVRLEQTTWLGDELSVSLLQPDERGVRSVANPPLPTSPPTP